MKNLSLIICIVISINSFGYFSKNVRARYKYETYIKGTEPTYYEGKTIGRVQTSSGTQGRYVETWSNTYTLSVSFYSGKEINDYLGTYTYSTYNVYAIVEWSNGGVSLVKLNKTISSDIVSESDLNSVYMITGVDNENRNWEIYF